MLPRVAAYFQKCNITALTYDPRTLGESDGHPRRDIDLAKHVSDLHDALTFLRQHVPLVHPEQIVYRGFSFNGVVALNAAALDKRCRAVIAVSPLTDLSYPAEQLPVLFRDAMRDREAQLAGGRPKYVAVLQKDGTCPYGWGQGANMTEYEVAKKSAAVFPTYENEMSLQTHYRISVWRPYNLMPLVAPTLVMIVTPEKDRMSLPQKQKALFDGFEGGPKEHVRIPERGHMDALTGPGFDAIMDQQIEFLRRHVELPLTGKKSSL
ncbi:DltD N-terminal domain protein [Xylariaceae sp. FL0255]|nr:DltD N-terminal domain protein [Xylariaceae sp. FL0255]